MCICVCVCVCVLVCVCLYLSSLDTLNLINSQSSETETWCIRNLTSTPVAPLSSVSCSHRQRQTGPNYYSLFLGCLPLVLTGSLYFYLSATHLVKLPQTHTGTCADTHTDMNAHTRTHIHSFPPHCCPLVTLTSLSLYRPDHYASLLALYE